MHDREIINAILKGDTKAFKILVDKYQTMIVNTCHGFIHDRHEAEDIAQDVFIQAYESLSKFKFESKLSTWLYKIAVNRSLNYCNSVRARIVNVDIDEWKKYEKSDTHEYPQHNALEEKELLEILHKCIDKLPENQRTAIILSKYEELSYKEIAEVMNISISAVESLIFRGKSNLEKEFSKLVQL